MGPQAVKDRQDARELLLHARATAPVNRDFQRYRDHFHPWPADKRMESAGRYSVRVLWWFRVALVILRRFQSTPPCGGRLSFPQGRKEADEQVFLRELFIG